MPSRSRFQRFCSRWLILFAALCSAVPSAFAQEGGLFGRGALSGGGEEDRSEPAKPP